MKNSFIITSVLVVLTLLGAILENIDSFSTAKTALRNRDIPSPLLNFGKRGQIFKEMGLRYIAPLDDIERGKRGWKKVTLDLTKMNVRGEWNNAADIPAENLPSSRILDKKVIDSGLPVFSIYTDWNDLYNERTGIYSNPEERGRNWERPCFVSYFNKGSLLFGSGAGIRIHGGTSRSHPVKNFRLYFRSAYGKESFGHDLLFSSRGDPLEHLVVKKADSPFGFSNSIPYDISRKIGCIAPYTMPVRLYLNGKPHGTGNAEIIEHLSREYLEAHMGHKDFIFYKVKGRKKPPAEYTDLYEWARFHPDKINFDSVSERIDIENFTSSWVFNIFMGNTDPYQGIALFNRRDSHAKWFWLTWDVDHCLANYYEPEKKYIWEKERPVSLVYSNAKKETDPRYFIFRKLMFSDETYRNFFKKRFTEAVNYRLDRDFLFSVVDYYTGLSGKFGMNMSDANSILHDFMIHRPLYSMQLMDRYFGLGTVYPVNFKIPRGHSLDIEGFNIGRPFTAYYYSGYKVKIKVTSGRVRFWYVNGVKKYASELNLEVAETTTVEPVL